MLNVKSCPWAPGMFAWLSIHTGEHLRADRKSDATNTDAERFHPARLRYWSVIVLQLSVAAFCVRQSSGRGDLIDRRRTRDRRSLCRMLISMNRRYRIRQD